MQVLLLKFIGTTKNEFALFPNPMSYIKPNSSGILLSVLLLFTGLLQAVNAQIPYEPRTADPMLQPWRFTYFPELDGQGIRSIAAGNREEAYWFAADSGVLHYDGYQWKTYDEADGLTGAPVTNVFVDESDHVYATTSHGVFEFSGDRWNNLLQRTGDPGFQFTRIRKLQSGVLICSSHQGVLLLGAEKTILLTTPEKWAMLRDQVKAQFVQLPPELLHKGQFDFFSDVFEPEPGKLWLAVTYLLEESGNVLVLFERDILNGEINHYDRLSALSKNSLGHEQMFFRMQNGDLWIINKANKLPAVRYSRGHWESVSYGGRYGDDEYSESIAQTADGKIWISGIGNLYSLIEQKGWTRYSADMGTIPQAHVELYAVGQSLWVYGHRSTVYRVDLSADTWQTYEHLNYAATDSQGVEWFLSVKGDVIFHNQDRWSHYTRGMGLISDPVRLFVDSHDIPWVIGSDRGVAAVAFLKEQRWQILRFETLSWSFDYRDIFEAADGSIWLGGCTDIFMDKGQTGGLVQIQLQDGNPEWQLYPARNQGLNQQNVYGIAQSSDGKIWIGGTALNFLDGKQWQRTGHKDLNDFVNIVHRDARGRLYAGSRQHGLYVKSDTSEEWERFSVENGLRSNNIISIATSADGSEIWAATDKDISLYKGGKWITGTLPAPCNLAYEGGAIFCDQSGQLWINHSPRAWKRRVYSGRETDERMQSGFLTYRYKPSTHAPETYVDLYNEEVDKAGNTAIFWSGRHFFNEKDRNDLWYSYRLNGGIWSDFTRETTHTFTGLSDGGYQFEVRAMDTDGRIDATPAVVHFEVIPPVWKQIWFLALIAGFIGIVAVYQYQFLKKRRVLKMLNAHLQQVNEVLEHRNQEIQIQKNSLEEAIQKIDQLSQAKVNFFTNITHEFRTPLSLIIGPIEQLSRKPAVPEVSGMYSLIRKNAIRLQKLINQLLELRRMESGTLELMPEEGDFVAFGRDVKALFDNQARDKNIRYFFRSEYQRLTIFFDKDKVEKILFNLLSNAFKYTPAGGEITIIVRPGDESHLELLVRDSGKGMTQNTLSRLFERYATDGISADPYAASSGIGLAYIRELVLCHQGTISVMSEPGAGTTFQVNLPVNLVPKVLVPSVSAAYSIGTSYLTSVLPLADDEWGEAGSGCKLLVVDDHEDMRFFLSQVLSAHYQVLVAENAEQAIDLLDQHDVELVISDVMMPERNGFSLCRQLKENPATSHLPVLLLTALGEKEAMVKGYEAGADGYLTKPFSPELLLVRIRNLQESKSRLKSHYQEGVQLLTKEVQLSSFDEKFLQKLTSLIEQNASESTFDVTTLCEMTHLSHAHFIRKVKHLTGMKPAELLKTYRLQQAKVLLSQNKVNVSEVGYLVGYDVPNSFTRAFKKAFGVSPSEYAHGQGVDC